MLISGVQQSASVIYACVCVGFPGGSAGKDSVMQETLVQFLGWEDPLEEGMATTPVFLLGEFHGEKSLVGYSPWGHRVRHD